MTDLHDDWWASLNHGGLLIAPAKIPAHFPDAPPPLSHARADRLRRDVVRMLDDDAYMGGFLDQVFESLLDLPAPEWLKASDVGAEWSHAAVTGEVVRPRRVWRGPNGEALPLFATDGKWGRGAPRIGVGKGRRAVSRVIEWLRNADREVAVLTNGRQIRLIHAGADYDAFCEWDIELWFDEGAPGPQVTALRRLLGRSALLGRDADTRAPLLQAIHESRRGQGELSAVLGERVRQAVELLIRSSSSQLEPVVGEGKVSPNEAYIAATRIVMRLVVVLFAEARELLPRVDPIYHGSYGLQGLREELDREAGGKSERLRHRHAAWPRLLGLFRLVYRGSAHGDLQVPEYGGGLFQPGDPESEAPISRALAAFESSKNALTDDVVHRMIELLTRSRVRVRQGRGSTWVEAPVDFSDLSSEYIGILYEGLLDYELRRAPADDPMVFLELGDQPALPLSRLDGMTAKERGELLKKLKTASKKSAPAEEESGEDEETESEEEPEAEEEESEDEASTDAEDETPAAEESAADDGARQYREMVDIWARNAVRDAGWTKRGADLLDDEVTKLARSLVRRVVLPGEWFLVRWGGTRKGAGTFYTRPQLAGPTTRRTLQPLAYRAVRQVEDPETGLVEVEQWEPRTPEEILKLRVCDPAMGSGSFPVSALRFLTEALFESLHHHHRLEPKGEGTIARLADGVPADHPSCETLPVPADHESFEDRLKARLKRHVVERCIYGVDIDPVAVELARLALWIETMDRTLPFEFLDHKLKCGNSLVGCWFDRFQDYPIRAWDREGGDQKHDRFVHHFREVVIDRGKRKGETERRGDPWTQAIKDRRGEVRAELAGLISSRSQPSFRFGDEHKDAEAVHAEAREAFEELHAIPIHDALERARFYAEHLANNPTLRSLRSAFDLWCALWFWPGDEIAVAPGPRSMHEASEDARRIVTRLAEQHRFFHWELEYPDVFQNAEAGFDAIIGNPPWDVQKPNSLEFFSNLDPLYRTLSKQEALRRQKDLFSGDDGRAERSWIEHCAHFKSHSNFEKWSSDPFGASTASRGVLISLSRKKAENTRLLEAWRSRLSQRRGYSDPAHPFREQGSGDVNTYKQFLEMGRALLRRNGHLAMLVPSGVYSDLGSIRLRDLFFDQSKWKYLYAFQNERFVFPGIDHRFKIAVLEVTKGGTTSAFLTRFRLGPGGSPTADEAERDLGSRSTYISLTVSELRRISSHTRSIVEIRNRRDVELLSAMHQAGEPLLGEDDSDWKAAYQTDLHMTNDSQRFVAVDTARAAGAKANECGVWLTPQGDALVPLYEGRMVGILDGSQKGWVSGRGRTAVWREIPWAQKSLEPQFLVRWEDARERLRMAPPLRTMFMDVTASTNTRTMIATAVPPYPGNHKAPTLVTSAGDVGTPLLLAAALASYAFDFQCRLRLVGNSLTKATIKELAAPRRSEMPDDLLASIASLTLHSPAYARVWIALRGQLSSSYPALFPARAALTRHERTRLYAIVNAVVAHTYGLDVADLRWVLQDTDWPVADIGAAFFAKRVDTKGFWREQRDVVPELRYSVLSLVALTELMQVGVTRFLSMNEGAGWLLPRTIRLADYGLGHDDRAKEHQPVASALGPRFYDWQLAQDAAESWEECERHAELLDRILPLPTTSAPTGVASKPQAGTTDLFGNPIETDLFGNPIPQRRGRR